VEARSQLDSSSPNVQFDLFEERVRVVFFQVGVMKKVMGEVFFARMPLKASSKSNKGVSTSYVQLTKDD